MKASKLIRSLEVAVEMYGDGNVVAIQHGVFLPHDVTALISEVHQDADGSVTHWLDIEEC